MSMCFRGGHGTTNEMFLYEIWGVMRAIMESPKAGSNACTAVRWAVVIRSRDAEALRKRESFLETR